MTEPTKPPVHLASMASALESGDRATLARVFAELADEALDLAANAPTAESFRFWGYLHETFHCESQSRLAPPKPKRRWFR